MSKKDASSTQSHSIEEAEERHGERKSKTPPRVTPGSRGQAGVAPRESTRSGPRRARRARGVVEERPVGRQIDAGRFRHRVARISARAPRSVQGSCSISRGGGARRSGVESIAGRQPLLERPGRGPERFSRQARSPRGTRPRPGPGHTGTRRVRPSPTTRSSPRKYGKR